MAHAAVTGQLIARFDNTMPFFDEVTGQVRKDHRGLTRYPFRTMQVGECFEILRTGNENPTAKAMQVYCYQRSVALKRKFVVSANKFPVLVITRTS